MMAEMQSVKLKDLLYNKRNLSAEVKQLKIISELYCRFFSLIKVGEISERGLEKGIRYFDKLLNDDVMKDWYYLRKEICFIVYKISLQYPNSQYVNKIGRYDLKVKLISSLEYLFNYNRDLSIKFELEHYASSLNA